MEGRDTADHGFIVPEAAVAVQFHEIREERVDIILCVRSVLRAGQLDRLPGAAHTALGETVLALLLFLCLLSERETL